MNINYIGIDPGLDGAVALIQPWHTGGDNTVRFADTPTLRVGAKGNKRAYDLPQMVFILKDWQRVSHGAFAFIEKSQAMPPTLNGRTQGVASSFSIGLGYGCWLGILAALGIPYECVAPVSWKKSMLRDLPKGKDASILKAMQLFPQAADQLRRKKDHGRAEALLIAEYGRRSREPRQLNSVDSMQSTGGVLVARQDLAATETEAVDTTRSDP